MKYTVRPSHASTSNKQLVLQINHLIQMSTKSGHLGLLLMGILTVYLLDMVTN